jgi:hypothetical protein
VSEVEFAGRVFDPVTGTWQPEAAIEQNRTSTGFSARPVPLLDGSGNALAVFNHFRPRTEIAASNYFSRSSGGWGQLDPSGSGIFGELPGSLSPDFLAGEEQTDPAHEGPLGDLHLASSIDGNFLLVWAAPSFSGKEILIARFTSRTRTWSAPQTVVPSNPGLSNVQRIGSDAGGNALVLFTEFIRRGDGERWTLNAIRVDHAGGACDTAQVIDSAVGGGAARADLGVDPQGHAMAIWQSFESGSFDDGSLNKIAINRFDGASWASAVFAEMQPGGPAGQFPRVSASGGKALLGWAQGDGAGVSRIRVLLQPLTNTPSQ